MTRLELKAYFIAKFSAIPEDRWCVGGAGNEHGERCALGHCHYTGECSDLSVLLSDRASIINDGLHPRYQQSTPKARILAALEDVV